MHYVLLLFVAALAQAPANNLLRPSGGIVGSVASVRLTSLDGKWHELALASGRAPGGARSVEVALESATTDRDYRNPVVV
jgi:hypothetical protein